MSSKFNKDRLTKLNLAILEEFFVTQMKPKA